MKLKYWLIGIIGILLAAVVGLLLLIFLWNKPVSCTQNPLIANLQISELPADESSLLRELQKNRKALAKLKPSGPYIVIDTHANYAYLRTEDSLLLKAPCSTGSGGELADSITDRRWVFDTPRGVFKVANKISDPWWRKPDWAFIEENEEIPKDPSERFDPNMLGDYALGFGDGYFIHGTLYERLLGINVTHGCVRLGADNLKFIYDRARIGTPIFIF